MKIYPDSNARYNKVLSKERHDAEPGWAIQYNDTKWLVVEEDHAFKGYSAISATIFDTEAEAIEAARDVIDIVGDFSFKAVPAWETLARIFRERIARFKSTSAVHPEQLGEFYSLVEEFESKFRSVFKKNG